MTQEKSNFWLGLMSGVAAVSLIGFIIMAVAFVNKDTETEFALNDDEEEIVNNQPTAAPSPTPAAPTAPVNIEVTSSDHVRGNPNAKVTIIEFSDYQCPFCQRFHETMKQAMADFPNDVRWVYKHFPLDSLHPFARQAAEATECANDQNKFWEYTDKLYENQSKFSAAYFGQLATELGLNSATFQDCLSSDKYADRVNDDFNLGRKSGVTGTPGSFINGELVKGAVPYDQLKSIIESFN